VTGRQRRSAWRDARVTALAVFLVPHAAAAQTSLQIPLQFDFLNPGAKSLAMGGAFAGLADDATAPFANPAGLTQLDRPELSVEFRGSRVRTSFLESGRLSGSITNEGTDTAQGAVFGTSTGSHLGIGFLAGVYVPTRRLPSTGRPNAAPRLWVVAAYRHELVRVGQSFFSQGVFQQAPEELTARRDTPQRADRAVSITAYGASGAYRPSPNFSLGASVTVYTFEIDSTFRRFGTVGFFGVPDQSGEVGFASQMGDDVALAPTVGALWMRNALRIGGVYRRGAAFAFDTVSGDEPARESVFRVPHTLAIGAAVVRTSLHTSGGVRHVVTFAGEITRASYSRLRRDFVTDQARASAREDSFTIDDITELHAGVQYSKPTVRFRPRVRAGLWYSPDHSIQFTPSPSSVTALDRLFDERLAAALSTGKGELHYTGGIGLTLGPRFELNAGVDLASTTRIFSTSVIVR
jgi:long-subunit fatty acid transport protein